MGGSYSNEFQIPCKSGEDIVYKCKNCNYSVYNIIIISIIKK